MLRPSRAVPLVENLLFPLPPVTEIVPRAPGHGLLSARQVRLAVLYVGVFCLAVVSQLLRVGGVPAWDTIYAEDYGIFLIQAIQHPWHLFIPYAGYVQLIPRIIAQLATMVPLRRAAEFVALASSAIDVACALFAYHASEGFIRSRALRAVLVGTILFVGIAPIEVVSNAANSQWYVMCALFWAVLWRPRTKTGMAASAIVGFLATATVPIAIIFVPILAIRLFVLRRPREHAVTVGYLAGWVLQIPVIFSTYGDHSQRVGRLAKLSQTVPYYFHTVPLRAVGWHLSWWLSQVVGWNTATVIVGLLIVAVLGWALTHGRQVQVFVVLALVMGFVETILSATITGYVTSSAPTSNWEMASRYSLMPIVLLDACAILAVDVVARRHGGVRAVFAGLARAVWGRPAPEEGITAGQVSPAGQAVLAGGRRYVVVAAVAALVVALACTWIPDYRFTTERVTNGHWAPVAASWLHQCRHRTEIMVFAWNSPSNTAPIPCADLVR